MFQNRKEFLRELDFLLDLVSFLVPGPEFHYFLLGICIQP
jgi:hypothetical protein